MIRGRVSTYYRKSSLRNKCELCVAIQAAHILYIDTLLVLLFYFVNHVLDVHVLMTLYCVQPRLRFELAGILPRIAHGQVQPPGSDPAKCSLHPIAYTRKPHRYQ